MGDSEKRASLTHLSKNFHYLFMLAVLWTADDETVFKNLVLARGRVTEPQEALVLTDCEFNNHPWTEPSDVDLNMRGSPYHPVLSIQPPTVQCRTAGLRFLMNR
jgi:hypothetical protein